MVTLKIFDVTVSLLYQQQQQQDYLVHGQVQLPNSQVKQELT
jgi:hypothetical protein